MVFRCTIFFTEKDPKFTSLGPSNIWLRKPSADGLEDYIRNLFRSLCVARGIPDATFRIEIRESSEEEMEQYILQRQAGHNTMTSVN